MSCPNATAPIDIDLANIAGNCDLKCDYKFSYTSSSCVATNRGNYIALSYDNQTNSPVLYNSTAYNVQELRLYMPSLHSYSGSKTDAELIVVHNSSSGSKPLLVCIPVKTSNSNSISASIFKSVIQSVSSAAPSDGESTEVNLNNYNLNNIIPKKPYFSYTASEPYQPCQTIVDYVVFDPYTASLDIGADSLATLQKVIKPNSYDVKTGGKLFFNKKGAVLGTGSTDDIYIDCQPVGSSDEEELVVSGSDSYYSTMSADDILKSPYFQLIIGAIVFFLIIYILQIIFSAIRGQKGGASIPSLPNFTNKIV